MSELIFKDLESFYMPKDFGKPKNWQHLTFLKDNYRLYYVPRPSETKDGFVFMFMKWSSCVDDPWDCPETKVEVQACGYGFFDGIRHMYFNQGQDLNKPDGYWYYPNMEVMGMLASELRKLEEKYCEDWEQW